MMSLAISIDEKVWLLAEFRFSDAYSQIAHKLSRAKRYKIVNKLCIRFLLLACNDKNLAVLGLFVLGFLPTMKFQLSQLP